MTAYFRDDVARLVDPDATGDGEIVLPGTIAPRTYPGGHYRYAVEVGGPSLLPSTDARLQEVGPAGRPVPAAQSACICFPPKHPQTLGGTSHETVHLCDRLDVPCWPLSPRRRRRTDLNVATAGDQNMVDYVKDYLGPMFEKSHPGVKVVAVGTGPGDARLAEDLREARRAEEGGRRQAWDFDVVVIHQKMAGQMVGEGLLAKYRDKIATGKLVTRDTATNALGANVTGYVMPMFHSQTAIAYNPDLVKDAARQLRRADRLGEEEPEEVRLQRHQGRHVGRRLRHRLGLRLRRRRRQADQGPYDAADQGRHGTRLLGDLKDFNKNVVITPGNAGTLDMLNRGEIAMGPVWVDMFYTWMADGKLPPNMKLKLVAPGMPGPADVLRDPRQDGERRSSPQEFIALATSPEVQAEGIVKRFNWYPGIDAKHLEGKLDQAVWKKLFADISPEDLVEQGPAVPDRARTSTTSSKPTRRRSRTERSGPAAPGGGSRSRGVAGPSSLSDHLPEDAASLRRLHRACFSSPRRSRWWRRCFSIRSASRSSRRSRSRTGSSASRISTRRSSSTPATSSSRSSSSSALDRADRRSSRSRSPATLTLGETPWLVTALAALYRWPLFIPFIVAAQCMRTFLAKNGLHEQYAGRARPPRCRRRPLSFLDWRGIIITFVWKQTPFVALLLAGAMASLDRATIEAARNLGRRGALRCCSRSSLPQVAADAAGRARALLRHHAERAVACR